MVAFNVVDSQLDTSARGTLSPFIPPTLITDTSSGEDIEVVEYREHDTIPACIKEGKGNQGHS